MLSNVDSALLEILCFIAEHIEVINFIAISVFAIFGLTFAWRRCRTADRNLLRERCQMGMQLLSQNLDSSHYTARVAGATILAEILDNKSTEYDKCIIRAFESFLFTPPVFGSDIGWHGRGQTDYESRDTYIIVSALQRYAKKKNTHCMLELPEGLPFIISKKWIRPNKNHPHYDLWVKARDRHPKYDS